MSSITLDAISQHLENAQTLVGLCKTMRCAHRQYLLNLSFNSVVESLELLRLEVRGERMAAAPVLGGSDDLEAAEKGVSPLCSPARQHSEDDDAQSAVDAFPTGSRSPSPSPLRPAFLEPLRNSPAPTPRPSLAAAVDAHTAVPVREEDDLPPLEDAVAVAVAPAAAGGAPQQQPATYADYLTAARNPPIVWLNLPRKNRKIELTVDYTQRQPISSYTEPSGTVFHGTLRRVAGRAKYLAGYKPSMESRDAPEEERISDVDVKYDIMYAAPDGTHKFLVAAMH